MNYSYVMGVDESILELEKLGFKINKVRNNYEVTFPKNLSEVWEEYITKKLDLGFWNEYITGDNVIFLFHLDTGIERYVVEDFINDEVLSLCERLCECKFDSLYKMLSDNEFYKKNVFNVR
ncbi:MAG: hypothetical protein HFE81_05125 [Bacilli bacterium]|nr:hypothetical protein [Bacilli bacterium]